MDGASLAILTLAGLSLPLSVVLIKMPSRKGLQERGISKLESINGSNDRKILPKLFPANQIKFGTFLILPSILPTSVANIDEVIRVNSQSGKGGGRRLSSRKRVRHPNLPKEMQRDFGPIANDEVDRHRPRSQGAVRIEDNVLA